MSPHIDYNKTDGEHDPTNKLNFNVLALMCEIHSIVALHLDQSVDLW